MVEHDDSRVGARAALAFFGDRRFGAQRVADKDRVREARIGHAKIRDRSAERGVADRHADHQAEREDAVDDALAEFGVLRKFGVEVQRLGIMRERAEDQVVGLRDRARDRMLENPAELEFPFRQTTLFKGMEGLPEVLTEPYALRRAYQAEIGAFLAEIKKGCQMINIDYIPLRTDQELDTALSSYIASRATRTR